jgi:hypothetical protein
VPHSFPQTKIHCPTGTGQPAPFAGRALVGQDIFLPGAAVGGGLKPEDAFVDQQFEPRGQHVFGDTEAFLKLAEAFHTAQRVANDQQRPPVADDIQRTGDGAGALFRRVRFTAILRLVGFIIKLIGGSVSTLIISLRNASRKIVTNLSH